MRGWRALAIVPIVAGFLTGPVLAQTNDSADADESARLVDPKECVSRPRSAEDLTKVLGLEGEGVPAPATISITPPLGDIVDPQTAISIKEVTREVVACFNANDIARAAGLMTDNGVKRAYWGLTINPAAREAAKTRLTEKAEPRDTNALVRLIAITDVSMLPDGRIAAFVVINEPLLPPAGPETLLFIFANEDGDWKVDDWVDFTIVPADFVEATPEATPTR